MAARSADALKADTELMELRAEVAAARADARVARADAADASARAATEIEAAKAEAEAAKAEAKAARHAAMVARTEAQDIGTALVGISTADAVVDEAMSMLNDLVAVEARYHAESVGLDRRIQQAACELEVAEHLLRSEADAADAAEELSRQLSQQLSLLTAALAACRDASNTSGNTDAFAVLERGMAWTEQIKAEMSAWADSRDATFVEQLAEAVAVRVRPLVSTASGLPSQQMPPEASLAGMASTSQLGADETGGGAPCAMQQVSVTMTKVSAKPAMEEDGMLMMITWMRTLRANGHGHVRPPAHCLACDGPILIH